MVLDVQYWSTVLSTPVGGSILVNCTDHTCWRIEPQTPDLDSEVPASTKYMNSYVDISNQQSVQIDFQFPSQFNCQFWNVKYQVAVHSAQLVNEFAPVNVHIWVRFQMTALTSGARWSGGRGGVHIKYSVVSVVLSMSFVSLLNEDQLHILYLHLNVGGQEKQIFPFVIVYVVVLWGKYVGNYIGMSVSVGCACAHVCICA